MEAHEQIFAIFFEKIGVGILILFVVIELYGRFSTKKN